MDYIFNLLTKLFIDRIQKNVWITVYKLWISYQNSMYGTNRINKRNKCIIPERTWWIFWVILILQNCHVNKFFPELNKNIGKEEITFPLSSSSRAIDWRKISSWIRIMLGSNWYNSITWIHNCSNLFQGRLDFSIGNEIRDTCAQLFIEKYIQLRKIIIPLCINSTDSYYFNLLRIIAVFYHLYIKHEIYN